LPKNPLPSNYTPPGGERYKVRNEDSWTSLAQKKGIDVGDLIEFNFKTRDPGEVNWYLRRNVGCRKTADDGRNWAFSADASPGFIYFPPPKKACGGEEAGADDPVRGRTGRRAGHAEEESGSRRHDTRKDCRQTCRTGSPVYQYSPFTRSRSGASSSIVLSSSAWPARRPVRPRTGRRHGFSPHRLLRRRKVDEARGRIGVRTPIPAVSRFRSRVAPQVQSLTGIARLEVEFDQIPHRSLLLRPRRPLSSLRTCRRSPPGGV